MPQNIFGKYNVKDHLTHPRSPTFIIAQHSNKSHFLDRTEPTELDRSQPHQSQPSTLHSRIQELRIKEPANNILSGNSRTIRFQLQNHFRSTYVEKTNKKLEADFSCDSSNNYSSGNRAVALIISKTPEEFEMRANREHVEFMVRSRRKRKRESFDRDLGQISSTCPKPVKATPQQQRPSAQLNPSFNRGQVPESLQIESPEPKSEFVSKKKEFPSFIKRRKNQV